MTDYSGLLADLQRALAAGVAIIPRAMDGEADAVVDHEHGVINIEPGLTPADLLDTLTQALAALPVSRASGMLLAAGGVVEPDKTPKLWPPLRVVE